MVCFEYICKIVSDENYILFNDYPLLKPVFLKKKLTTLTIDNY